MKYKLYRAKKPSWKYIHYFRKDWDWSLCSRAEKPQRSTTFVTNGEVCKCCLSRRYTKMYELDMILGLE